MLACKRLHGTGSAVFGQHSQKMVAFCRTGWYTEDTGKRGGLRMETLIVIIATTALFLGMILLLAFIAFVTFKDIRRLFTA